MVGLLPDAAAGKGRCGQACLCLCHATADPPSAAPPRCSGKLPPPRCSGALLQYHKATRQHGHTVAVRCGYQWHPATTSMTRAAVRACIMCLRDHRRWSHRSAQSAFACSPMHPGGLVLTCIASVRPTCVASLSHPNNGPAPQTSQQQHLPLHINGKDISLFLQSAALLHKEAASPTHLAERSMGHVLCASFSPGRSG